MKKIMIAALALSLAAPAAALAKAGGDDRWERRRDRYEHRLERRQDRFERRLERRGDRAHHRGYGHGYHHGPTVYHQRPARHYYYAPAPTYRYYAPPPAYGYGYAPPPAYGYGYGYAPRWHRGQVLPHQYRRYVVHNYHDYGWGRPPYGHAYYRTDGGNVVLAAIATGLILSVFAGAF
jgi:Ni/Co efflux regulator RcnB